LIKEVAEVFSDRPSCFPITFKKARSYSQFMSATKYLTVGILAIFLHQPIITFFSISSFGEIYADRIGIVNFAWAEDNACPQIVPENQEESLQSPGNAREPSEQ